MSPHETDVLFEMLHKIMEQNTHLDINLKKLSLCVENHKCEPEIRIAVKPKAKSIKKHVKKIRS